MTPKERRDAQIELRDWALEYEMPSRRAQADIILNAEYNFRWHRAQLLRLIAAELDRVPEES